MTAMFGDEAKSRSRRALLAGAIGGVGAWAAAAIGGISSARAGVDGDVVLGAANSATAVTSITNAANNANVFTATSNADGDAVAGTSQTGNGVVGTTSSGTGVYGGSSTSTGVVGFSTTATGVMGEAFGGSKPANIGWQAANGTGLMGYSGAFPVPAGKPKTGAFGYAAQDSSSRGVWGESPAGIGLYGRTTTGFAGYFHGKVFTNSFVEILEMATPAAPGADRARLFVRDSAGKSQLCVRFPTGAVIVLATEP